MNIFHGSPKEKEPWGLKPHPSSIKFQMLDDDCHRHAETQSCNREIGPFQAKGWKARRNPNPDKMNPVKIVVLLKSSMSS
jgi:hypothetical protein